METTGEGTATGAKPKKAKKVTKAQLAMLAKLWVKVQKASNDTRDAQNEAFKSWCESGASGPDYMVGWFQKHVAATVKFYLAGIASCNAMVAWLKGVKAVYGEIAIVPVRPFAYRVAGVEYQIFKSKPKG